MAHIGLNAHLLSAQAGYRSAGIHGYIYHTLNALPTVKPDWEYTVLVGEGQPPDHPQIHVERSHFKTTSPLRRIFWEQMIQPRVLKHLNIDLYHALAFVAPPRLKLPLVVTVYDLTFIRYPEALSRARRLYLQTFTRRTCEQAAAIIAISESTADDIVQLLHIPREKIVVAVPGVSDQFQPVDAAAIETFRQQRNLPSRFLLHLGTLEPRKNLVMLLRAYADLPTSIREEVHLVLAGGKGWLYDEIFETVNRLHLQDVVHFPGFVNSVELPLWYNAADALVYPSLFEGWGLPVVEAMASGCPTLVSDISSLPEAAGDTGLRLPPGDVSAWTDAMLLAITDQRWRHNSREAGLSRAYQFTWQATAAATIQAYQRALR